MTNFDPHEYKNTLYLDSKGKPQQTIQNICSIFDDDPVVNYHIAYNLLTNQAEAVYESGNVRIPWTDSDDAQITRYLESVYDIYCPIKQEQAFKLALRERKYHPIRDKIRSLVWDKTDRLDSMLKKYMHVADSPYSRQVSRLIFSGGIHRIFEPGSKFDFVPVLIGKNQGEGKSTFVRWLAMDDKYFREIGEIEGQRGIESLEGGWICELGELLALKRCKEVEAVKSYITRQSDSYRKPYDRRISVNPRQCIFIGTTNSTAFLTDKSGNRRYLPVECYSTGRKLYSLKEECMADIEQCWAQAYAMYSEGKLSVVPEEALDESIKANQQGATIDDYRIGMIAEYLEHANRVCVIELYRRALHLVDKPSRVESLEITQIMDKFPNWEKLGGAFRHLDYGPQKVWEKQI